MMSKKLIATFAGLLLGVASFGWTQTGSLEKELDRMQAMLLREPEIYIQKAKLAGPNPNDRAIAVYSDIGTNLILPHLIEAEFPIPNETETWTETYLVAVLWACDDRGEFDGCSPRILAKQLPWSQNHPLTVLDAEDTQAVSTDRTRVRIDYTGILEVRQDGQKQIFTGAQLIETLWKIEKAGKLKRDQKRAKEQLQRQQQTLQEDLNQAIRSFEAYIQYKDHELDF